MLYERTNFFLFILILTCFICFEWLFRAYKTRAEKSSHPCTQFDIMYASVQHPMTLNI